MCPSSTSSSEHARTPASGDPVATISAEVVQGRLRFCVAAFAVAFFVLVVFGSAIIDLVVPVPAPKLMGMEKAKQDKERSEARFSDGSLAKLIESDLELTSRVRRTALAIYSPLLLRLFREAGSTFVAGDDGFIFRRDRIRTLPNADEAIRTAVGRIAALQRCFARFGTRVIAMPLPRKAATMRTKLPPNVDAHPELDDRLAAALRAAGSDFVDLEPVFAATAHDPAYLAVDSHWSWTGMKLAAEALAKALLGDRPLPQTRLLEGRSRTGSSVLAHALGLDDMAEALLPAYESTQYFVADQKLVTVTSTPPKEGPLPPLLVGTSFSKHTTDESTFFGIYLSTLLGGPLWNGARAGATVTQSLAEALRKVPDRLPPAIMLEIPNHQVFCTWPLQEIGDVWAQLPVPERLQSLQHDEAARFGIRGFVAGCNFLPGKLTVPRSPPLLARIDWDGFVYPRDGTVVVVARGKITGEPLQLIVDMGLSRYYEPWRAGRDAIAMPLAGDGLGQRLDVAAIAMKEPTNLELTQLEVCCDLDLAGGRAGSSSEGEGTTTERGGWRQVFDFPPAEPVADDCIGVAIDSSEPQPVVAKADAPESQREVHATFTDGTTACLFGPGPVTPTVRMLLPIAQQGRVLASVSVLGKGPAPSGSVRVWHLRRLR